MEDSSQLLTFLTAATSNLQEALSKPSNGKKVNHRKYIQKRLQKRDTKSVSAKKTPTKPSTASAPPTPALPNVSMNGIRPHPVAVNPLPYWPSPVTSASTNNSYYQMPPVSAPTPPLSSSSSSSSLGYSRPPSCPQPSTAYDPEFESLLNEFGLDSPSQYSEVSARGGNLSRQPSLNTVHWESYLPPNEFIPSPPSDFSDVDDSAYSSPCNPSPVYYPVPVCSPPSTSCYQHHVATASCEWLPTTTCGPSTVVSSAALPPSLLNITPTLAPSLNEILELVTP